MDKGSTVPDGNELQPSEGELRLQVSLSGMDIADSLRIDLPHQSGDNSLSEFLEQVFPADETSQQQMSSMLDVRANPDLLEIYDAILAAFDEWRDGRCELEFFGDGELPLDLGAAVATQVLQGGEGLDGGNPPDPPLRKGGETGDLYQTRKTVDRPRLCKYTHPRCKLCSKLCFRVYKRRNYQ